MLATTNRRLNAGVDVTANSGSSAKPELDDTGSPSALIHSYKVAGRLSGSPRATVRCRNDALGRLSVNEDERAFRRTVKSISLTALHDQLF